MKETTPEAMLEAGTGTGGEPAEPARVPSMRDVAEAAGVSVSTVSRALNNTGGISDEVRLKIADVAANLGYNRRLARRLAAGQSVLMAVALDVFSGDAAGFYREIMEAIEDELDRIGVSLETLLLDGNAADLDRVAEFCGDRDAVGVLCVGTDSAELLEAARASAGAVLLVNGVDPLMRVDGVTPSNRRGAFLATSHLIERGHRRIAIVTALHRQTLRDRLDGYRAALAAHGCPFDPGLVFEIPQLQPEAAAAATRKAMKAKRLDATAIFAGSDMVAVGVISALAREGLAVPDDISIVGFDNTRITARTRPGLTTVAVDMREIGRHSVRRLLDRLAMPQLTQVDIHIGCHLVERESTRDLRPEHAAR